MTFSNKVNWAINPDRCALLIHDMQSHYLGAVPVSRRDRLVSNTRAIADACAKRGLPIFASQVPLAQESRERGLMLDMWGRGPVADAHCLDPGIGLAVRHIRLITKRSYSAFYGNDFEIMLRRLGRDAIIIVGVYTSIGCHLSAADAFMRDIQAFLIADATADMEERDHAAGLAVAARTCARVMQSPEVLAALSARNSAPLPPTGAIDVC